MPKEFPAKINMAIAACLAVATPAAAQSPVEAVTPNFEHAIPNIPGGDFGAFESRTIVAEWNKRGAKHPSAGAWQ
jgi:hypothetical protein